MKTLLLLLLTGIGSASAQSFFGGGIGAHLDYFHSPSEAVDFNPRLSYNINLSYRYALKKGFNLHAQLEYKETNVEYKYVDLPSAIVNLGQNYHTGSLFLGGSYSIKHREHQFLPGAFVGLSYASFKNYFTSGTPNINTQEQFQNLENNNHFIPFFRIGIQSFSPFQNEKLFYSFGLYYSASFASMYSPPLNVNYVDGMELGTWGGSFSYISFTFSLFFNPKSEIVN